MPTAIGLRFYQILARRLRDREKAVVDASDLKISLPDFLGRFVQEQKEEGVVSNEEAERTFYFDPIELYNNGSVRGYIHYGTFGFESRIKKPNSKKIAYTRSSKDVEEIPLYFDIWCPESVDFAVIAIQSFGVRSCIHLVVSEMQKTFEAWNPGFKLHCIKLMGNDSPRNLFANAPVKKLKLVRHDAQSDRFSSYRAGQPPKAIDMEVSYKAKRGGNLGYLRDFGSAFSENDQGFFLFDGGEFNEATAEVMIGKRRRPVGIIGPNSDTGAIDISESVIYANNGHPTFESIRDQSDDIMEDFYRRLTKT